MRQRAEAIGGLAVSSEIVIRGADPSDAASIAALHANSWRRHYRGAYSDEFLDGDVDSDRLEVWSSRLTVPSDRAATHVAIDNGTLVGFVHVILNDDASWGSLIENLHVTAARHREGVGRKLMATAGTTVLEQAPNPGLYLWVLAQNLAAQRFYVAIGGNCVEEAPCPPPGGVVGRLSGAPMRQRMIWAHAEVLL